jgi:hypothetical protein
VFDSGDAGGSGLALGITTFGSFVFPRASVGSFTACLPAVNTQPTLELFGRTTSGNYVTDIVVNLPTNARGKDCTTWSYGDYPNGGPGWGLVSGSFTVTAPAVTPEPGAMALAGSGLLMLATFTLISKRRKRISLQA